MEFKSGRKAVAIMFVMTGVVSLGMWLLGGGKFNWSWGESKLSFDVVMRQDRGGKDQGSQTVKVEQEILAETSGMTGKYGVYVFRLGTGRGYGVGEDQVMTAASIMKVPIMVAVYQAVEQGKVSLQDKLVIDEADRRDGTGPVDTATAGAEFSVNDMLDAVGKESDNTAAAALVRVVGAGAVDKAVGDLGMEESSFAENKTTAADVAMMWVKIYKAQVFGADTRDKMLLHLQDGVFEDRITEGVPVGVTVVHKVGTGEGVWSDGGVVIPQTPGKPPFVLVVLNEGVDVSKAQEAVPQITKVIWDYEESRSD